MIELNNIYKWVNQGASKIFLLKDLNLTMNHGEFVSIMGPSGSGKSTLLNIIGMLDAFDEGNYLFNGSIVSSLRNNDKLILKIALNKKRLSWFDGI